MSAGQPQAELFLHTIGLGVSPAAAARLARAAVEAARAFDNANGFGDDGFGPEGWEPQPLALPPPLVDLEGEQIAALAAITEFLNGDHQHFALFGYAGTGKTTVLAHLARAHRDFLVVAPTGKAATVLSRKIGAHATTLHHILYRPVELQNGGLVFEKPFHPNEFADCTIVVDEASMVDEATGADLLESGATIIASGDPGQLPPVRGTAFFGAPDFTLEQIRRQAAGNPIIRQAHRVRSGLDYESDGEGVQAVTRRDVAALDRADIILCWKNATRHAINRFIRQRRRILPSVPPLPGEPIVCLENSPEHGIMNGEVSGIAAYDVAAGVLTLDNGVDIENPWFEWLYPDGKHWPRRKTPFGLGYCITVHKAQGSEWPHVAVLDEFDGADRARWLYTAITRAAETVRIVRG